MNRNTTLAEAVKNRKVKTGGSILVLLFCALLFFAGCGADANEISNDGSTVSDVGLTTFTVPLQDGGDVECVVAQYIEAALSCNWGVANQGTR